MTLCDCLSAEADREPEILLSGLASADLDWTALVDMATDQLVAPMVGARLDREALRDAIPELVQRYFRAMLRLNRSRNRQLQREAVALARALNGIDVVPVFLKGGAGLVSGLYDDIGLRVMSDLDILIPEAREGDCASCLEALGYVAGPRDGHPVSHSLGTFTSGAAAAPLDLHRQALAYPFHTMLPRDAILRDAVTFEQDGARLACPSPTHQLVLNIGHAQLNDHGRVYGHLPLRALADYRSIREAWPDRISWREVRTRFATAGASPALDYHGLAAEKLLGADPVPSRPARVGARLLLRRARFMVGHPRLLSVSNRVLRVGLLLRRELSSPELRRRLWRNMSRAQWWRRHIRFFWDGRR